MHVDVEVGDRCESVMEHVLKEDDRKATVANLRSQCQVLTAKQIKIQNRLEQWRNQFTVQQAKTQNKNNKQSNNFTMGVLCSGGCLDTLAGMRAGFKPIWCTEIDHEQQEMFRDLTRGEPWEILSATGQKQPKTPTTGNLDNPVRTTQCLGLKLV